MLDRLTKSLFPQIFQLYRDQFLNCDCLGMTRINKLSSTARTLVEKSVIRTHDGFSKLNLVGANYNLFLLPLATRVRHSHR